MRGSTLKRIALVAAAAVVAAVAFRVLLRHQAEQAEREDATAGVERALELRNDPEQALREARQAVKRFEEDARLRLLLGRAYHARGLYRQALESFSEAHRLDDGGDLERELRFFRGRSLMCRFLETRDRQDFNQAVGDLRAVAAAPGEHAAAAKVLIGLGLAEESPFREPHEALESIEAGLALDRAPAEVGDMARVEETLARLRQETARQDS